MRKSIQVEATTKQMTKGVGLFDGVLMVNNQLIWRNPDLQHLSGFVVQIFSPPSATNPKKLSKELGGKE